MWKHRYIGYCDICKKKVYEDGFDGRREKKIGLNRYEVRIMVDTVDDDPVYDLVLAKYFCDICKSKLFFIIGKYEKELKELMGEGEHDNR